MSDGWESEAEALEEFHEHYQGSEFDGCFVTELDGRFVIAY